MLVIASLLLAIALPQGQIVDEARSLLDDDRASEAVRLLEEALANGDGDAREVRLILARAQAYDGQAEAAIATLDALPAREDHDVSLGLGRAYLAWADEMALAGASQEDIDFAIMDAQSHFERAMSLSEDGDGEATAELGNLHLYRYGDWQTALSIADTRLKAAADDADARLLRGTALCYQGYYAAQDGDQDTADQAYASAEEDLLAADEAMGDERTEAQSQLSWLYAYGLGDGVRAVEAAGRVVDRQLDPDYSGLYQLAKNYAYNREFDAAGAALEKIVSLSARDLTRLIEAEGEEKTGVCSYLHWAVDPFVRRNDRATARSVLAAIVAADPRESGVWHNYAVMCDETARYEDAVKAYEKIIELDGDRDPRPYNDLATLLHFNLDRDHERAMELYKTCVTMSDEILAQDEIDDAWRSHVAEARSVAQGNIDSIQPPAAQPGLLDSMLEGLRNLNLPEEGAEGEEGEDTTADAAEGEAEGTGT